MKAIVCKKYGPPDTLGITDVPAPQPTGNEVLVYVKAAAVNAYDWRVRPTSPGSRISSRRKRLNRLLIGPTPSRKLRRLSHTYSNIPIHCRPSAGRKELVDDPNREKSYPSGEEVGSLSEYLVRIDLRR